MTSKKYYIYMLRCLDESIYTGITTDLQRRMSEHFSRGVKCAKYTRRHKAMRLERAWKAENRVLASRLEYYIKRLSKAEKELLIKNGDLESLKMAKIENLKYTKLDMCDIINIVGERI